MPETFESLIAIQSISLKKSASVSCKNIASYVKELQSAGRLLEVIKGKKEFKAQIDVLTERIVVLTIALNTAKRSLQDTLTRLAIAQEPGLDNMYPVAFCTNLNEAELADLLYRTQGPILFKNIRLIGGRAHNAMRTTEEEHLLAQTSQKNRQPDTEAVCEALKGDTSALQLWKDCLDRSQQIKEKKQNFSHKEIARNLSQPSSSFCSICFCHSSLPARQMAQTLASTEFFTQCAWLHDSLPA